MAANDRLATLPPLIPAICIEERERKEVFEPKIRRTIVRIAFSDASVFADLVDLQILDPFTPYSHSIRG